MRQQRLIAIVAALGVGTALTALAPACGTGTSFGLPPPDADAKPYGSGAPDPSHAPSLDGGVDAGSPALLTGEERLVELFAVPDGALVVTTAAVLRIDRAGTVVGRWAPPRSISAAAFDGHYLGVADKAMLWALDASLSVVSSTFLVETCAAAVLVDDARFVCGPSVEDERIYSVYDLAKGGLLAKSVKSASQEGSSMRHLPGTSAFLTANGSDFYLYRVGAGDIPVFVGQSDNFSEYSAVARVGFVGWPADHLVTVDGVLLSVTLVLPDGGAVREPFRREALLGTLRPREVFVAFDRSGEALAALVGDGWCSSGCALQRIDVASRTVLSSRPGAVFADELVLLRHDPAGDGAWIGSSAYDKGPYRIDWVPY